MNVSTKRLLSILLSLAMVLAILPMAVFAEAPTTLFVQPNSNWNIDNARFAAYFFGNGETWVDCTLVADSDGIYEVAVPEGYPNVIFCRMNPKSAANNWSNKWNQTSDLKVPTDGTNCYIVAPNSWDSGKGQWTTFTADGGVGETEPTTESPIKYSVAGEATLCGSAWTPDDINNMMTDEDGDGIYTITYTAVAAGSYQFKVTDGTWSNSWGGDGPGGNYLLTLDATANVEIRFDTATSTITVLINGEEAEEPSTEPTEPSVTEPFVPGVNEYCLVGFINGADYGCEGDHENIGEYIFVDGTLATSFTADSYIFVKTTDNAKWFMTETYCAETTGTFVSGGSEKMFVPGNVELTFTLVENEDGTLTVSYVTGADVPTEPTDPSDPSDPSDPTDPSDPSIPVEVAYYVAGSFNDWNAKDETYRLSDNGDGTWSLVIDTLAAGSYEMKVTDGTWTNSWGNGSANLSFKVDADNDPVTVTFNSETFEITVEGAADPDPLVINSIHVAGSAGLVGYEWDPAQNQMTADGSVYTITFTGIAAGKYEFKFVANGAWGLDWASGIEMPSGEVQTAWVKPMGNSIINVAENDSTVTLTLDLTAMDPITGEGGTCCATIETAAMDPDFTGLKELADGSYYFVNGVQSTATGLTKIDGVWYYLKSGRWASELNQLAKYNGEWWYLVDGKVASSTTALIDLNGEDWYVVKGKIAANTTGLIKVDGIWYYVVKGKVAGNTTNLIKYNGEWFYVVKGKVASTTTAMIKFNGEDWYVVKGKIAANTTGLVKYDGVWYYVVKGKLAGNTTSLVKYNNEWFYVINGRVDSKTTGIVVYSGGWYYLVKGKIAAKTTTLVKHGGAWYYVEAGSVNWKFSGTFKFAGKNYTIKNGRVV